MSLTIEASCGCNMGKIRKNNEDNFYFAGKCLERDNIGLKHPVVYDDTLSSNLCFAVFDGMGGENFGEYASFSAAKKLQQTERTLADYFVTERKYLNNLVVQLNNEVVKTKCELCTDRMGTTMVSLHFWGKYVYVCNLGDSRAYRLRDGEFLQISQDHIAVRPGKEEKKAPLTQYLGIDPEEMQIEPYIARGKLERGDMYLICSDGLTDMLSNFEIADIMLNAEDMDSCVQKLIDFALERGGRDNITAIVCKLT